MQRMMTLAVILGALLFGFTAARKATAQIHQIPLTHNLRLMPYFHAMDDPPPIQTNCNVVSNTETETDTTCCPPPGTSGNCVTFRQHHPIMEDPPSSCTVEMIYETDYYGGPIDGGYILVADTYLYEIDPMSLSCE